MHSACVVEIVKRFKEQADADAAMPMIKYMRNQFAFLGLPSPVEQVLRSLPQSIV